MWARNFEVALGLWLAVSPFVFRYDLDGDRFHWWNSYLCALAIVVVALAAYRKRLSRIHLAHLPVAVWLVLSAYTVAPPPPVPGPFQNYVMVGWLLAMLAVLPSHASRPPDVWEAWWRDHPEMRRER